MGVTVRINGFNQAKKRLNGFADRAMDLTPVWPSVGRYLSRTARRQFQTRGAFLGTPWKPLKPEYKLWKLRHGFPVQPLVMTGGLREEFTGRPMQLEEYFKDSAKFGSTSNKAGWHQRGTRRNGKRVNPPRKMLVVTRQVRESMGSIVVNHLMGREYRP